MTTTAAPLSSRPTLTFSSRTWRHRLAAELVHAGIDHDRAALIARNVLAAMTRPTEDADEIDGRDTTAPA